MMNKTNRKSSLAPTSADVVPDIQCEGVEKRFVEFGRGDLRRVVLSGTPPARGFDALKEISLVVQPGQFLGLLGANGAGKSTLLRTIGGVYHPSSGFVRLGDQVSGIYELGITNQQMMTGEQYTRRWLTINNMSRQEIDASVKDIKEFSELGDYFEQPVRTYSSGMKSRLFFGVATALKAKIFLIDEVLSVGDIYFTAKCWKRLRSLLSDGASGVLATHDWASVLRLCDQACVLEHGRISDSGTAREVVRKYLNMPEMNSHLARFDLAEVDQYHGASGEDLHLSFPVEVFAKGAIFFGLSVETFVPGEGWEHVLQHDSAKITANPGRHTVRVTIPDLPLNAGSYVVNLFLNCREPDNKNEIVACDARGWTFGNELKLVVSGPTNRRGYGFPVKWGQS